MSKQSAGVLMYRWQNGHVEVFLVHPGGPFWSNKDVAGWSIPKGEFEASEEALSAAKREFNEETGLTVEGTFLPLTPSKQSSGKIVHAWAVRGDCDPRAIKSNIFSMEWPPRSGQMEQFPEVDRAEWFDLESARKRIHKGQIGFLDELEERLARRTES